MNSDPSKREGGVFTKPTREEQDIIMDPNPVWECNPPQREECTTDEAYAEALIGYAKRVVKFRKSNLP